ncbi:DNA polymerase III subunit beta [Singulisphaera sp. PoT]|uniref:DNA polymerase III subunit beta n=1 Tax=Singulisphaera sp. PoT TaxID=3411797 RepID=UPI003BF61562
MTTATMTKQQISIHRETLDEALHSVAGAAAAKSIRPIIQNVLLRVDEAGNASLYATDLEASVWRSVGAIEGGMGIGIAMVLNPQRLGAILATTPDESLCFEAEDDRVTIRGKACSFTLASEDPALFPVQGDDAADSSMRLDAAELRRALRRTSYALDVESARYALNGVILERDGPDWVLVATDGRRLSRQVIRPEIIGDEAPFLVRPIIPSKTLKLLERTLDEGTVEFSTTGTTCRFDLGETRIWSRLAEGRFPRWQDAMPRSHATRVPMKADELRNAVQQAAILVSRESRAVDFAVDADRLRLSTESADVGASRVEMPIASEGPDQRFALDPGYVVDALKSLEGGEVRLEILDDQNPIVIRTDDGFTGVFMPITREK